MDVAFGNFDPLVGSSFSVMVGDETISAELMEATLLPEPKNLVEGTPIRQQPFSLLFRLPTSANLPQAIYSFTHQTFAEPIGLFIVPVAADGEGRYFEAIFT